jgi:IS1 family transposase
VAYLYRAVDQYGQVIDVWLSARRDLTAARTFFTRALATGAVPVEVITDRAPAYPRALDELIPTAVHDTEQYANNTIEANHGRLKARLRPMRGLKTFRSARVLAGGVRRAGARHLTPRRPIVQPCHPIGQRNRADVGSAPTSESSSSNPSVTLSALACRSRSVSASYFAIAVPPSTAEATEAHPHF